MPEVFLVSNARETDFDFFQNKIFLMSISQASIQRHKLLENSLNGLMEIILCLSLLGTSYTL